MIDLEQFKELDPIEVSDEKMKYFSEELLKMHDELTDAWAEELKTLETEEFDPYSFFGERKIKKLAKKHAPKIAEVDMLLDVIDDEMQKREKFKDEQRYVDGGNITTSELSGEEFLKEEQKKTERIRRKYED